VCRAATLLRRRFTRIKSQKLYSLTASLRSGSDYILDLALDRGLDVAYSCRAGQCGTCKVTLLEGSVEQDCTSALTPDDEKDGHILACQARPTGRVVVDL